MQEPTSNIPSVSVEVGSASEDSSLCEVGTAPADGNVINHLAIAGLHVSEMADISLVPRFSPMQIQKEGGE